MSYAQQQQQESKKGLGAGVVVAIIFGGILGLCVLVGGIAAMAYIGAANKGNQMENSIDQLRQASASTLSNLTQTIQEQAQVPEMATDHLKQIIEAQMTGRYGADGSKAVFQFLKEQNLQVDQRMYLNIQAAMSGGRKEFEISQNRLLSQCRAYKDETGNVWSGFWLRLAGYPKADLAVVCRAVTDTKTDAAFETGHQTKISLK
ncbi:putative structural protein [Salmonella phage vB_SalM_SA002]|nr:putative structural protein [Salmonella phage vB_SalM_SA002]